jgi:hypothetical protein
VIRGPENKPAEKGEEPISPGRRAERIGKRVMVSSEESEEVPLRVNRGKGRPEKAGKPLPFTAMLGFGNPKTRSDRDPGLEAEMRLLGCLDEEEEQQQWDDLPPNAYEPEAPFSLGLGAQGTKPRDKLQALLQEKVEKEKEKEKESPAKGEGSGKEIQWPEGLAQQEATLAEVTAGGNIVNPQAQLFGAEDEEKGEEVASPSMRVRATDQDMVDALLEIAAETKRRSPCASGARRRPQRGEEIQKIRGLKEGAQEGETGGASKTGRGGFEGGGTKVGAAE